MNTRRRLVPRTQQLPRASKVLYGIEHYSSLARVAILIAAVLLGLVVTSAALDFPTKWVNGFEVCTSAVTLVMLFVIQHTEAREQTAIQRKLDELLRALPGADESMMMLEESPADVLLDTEERQRATARGEERDGRGDGESAF